MMVYLDVLGRLDDFADVFDLEYYHSNKNHALLTVFKSAQKGKPADQDLIALMRERNFNFKISKNAMLRLRPRQLSTRVKNILSKVPNLKAFYRKIRGRT
jgi:hypothetical protein